MRHIDCWEFITVDTNGLLTAFGKRITIHSLFQKFGEKSPYAKAVLRISY
jgi:hypothetical protein